MALGVGEHRTVVVVCDGVSSSTDSDVASLAAARAARDVLQVAPGGPSDLGPRAEHWRSQFTAAARAAQDAAVAAAATTRIGNVENPPSCTFVAAVIDEPLVASAWIGDSRAYWFGDDGTATQLSVDDSWASGEIAGGVAREVAEADPRAHSITRWLGVDSPGGDPSYTSIVANGPGWLVVCSDGLWNYCSDAAALRDLTLEQLTVTQNDPLVTAGALVDWANAQGGHDNVTVALARVFETNSARCRRPTSHPRQGARDGHLESRSVRERIPRRRRDRRARDRVDRVQRCRHRGSVGGCGRAHRRRHVGVDGVAAHQDRRGSGGSRGCDRRDHRRHVLRGDRRQPGARLVYPYQSGMVLAERAEPDRCQGGGATPRHGGRHRDRRVAPRRDRSLQLRRSGAAPRDPAHRRPRRVRDARRDLQNAIAAATGVFQCDCRGVGADWDVNELRGIASALLGIGRHHRRAHGRWPTTSAR